MFRLPFDDLIVKSFEHRVVSRGTTNPVQSPLHSTIEAEEYDTLAETRANGPTALLDIIPWCLTYDP